MLPKTVSFNRTRVELKCTNVILNQQLLQFLSFLEDIFMDVLYEYHDNLISQVSDAFFCYLIDTINWSSGCWPLKDQGDPAKRR